ncbi:DUF6686 family protein [Sphingobacterium sp. SYP-B4668]|uniref:DUF6686 family protein n=1 Tax=Sphingobacterium sp. SYP-B4668 TaxID=2996035 RepID=UPI0022DDEE70|nr:DUF6686 family protein [Sphingobacterium sp. SYP-B4668]
MCQTIILSEKGVTHISLCRKCSLYYIWQSSFVLTFNKGQFESFVLSILNKADDNCYYIFPDGEGRITIETPCPEIVFNFNTEEWDDFKNALNESYYFQQFYNMIG